MAQTQRDRQREATRERLFHAALEIFRRDGVERSRIEDIAALAKVSRPTFYFHFPTKQDVLLQLQSDAEDAFEANIRDLPEDATIQDVFQTTATTISERWARDPGLFVEVGIASLRHAATQTDGTPVGVRQAIGERFERAARQGDLSDALPAQILADLYLANTFAVALGWANKPELPLVTVLQFAAAFFLNGAKGQ